MNRLNQSLFFGLAMAMLSSLTRGDTLSFQHGDNGYFSTVDTTLKEAAAGIPQNTSSRIEWDSDDPPDTGLSSFALIRFDDLFGLGADQIEQGAQITNATLSYQVTNSGHEGMFYESAVDFSNATTFDSFGALPGVQPADLGVFVMTAPGSLETRTINVTGSLATWSLNPSANRGWIVVPTGGNGVDARSSESSSLLNRPKLTVVINEGEPQPLLTRRPYLQSDTGTSIVIAWKSDVATSTRVRYGSSPAQPDFVITDPSPVVDHVVQIANLTPGTRYYYDVGTKELVMAGGDVEHYFDTAPPTEKSPPFSVWIVGDSGNGSVAQIAVRDAMIADTQGNEPDLFVHLGDMAYESGTTTEFTNTFFAPYANILRHTVCWPTIGNHEGGSSSSGTQSGPYYDAYVLPTGGEAGGLESGTEAYYSFDYANAHFVCLDSHDTDRAPGSAMLTWLEEDIAATDRQWLIAFWHHPPYTKGSHDSDDTTDSGGRLRDMRENVLPMLEAAGVDLVLGGHSHIYERSFLVDGAYDTPTTAPGHILDNGDGHPAGDGAYFKPLGLQAHRGAVYVVAGHGGRGIGGTGGHPLMYFSELENGSCILDIDGDTLSLRNIRDDGAITDEFSIQKSAIDPIPAASSWSVVVMALMTAVIASLLFWIERRPAYIHG